MLKGIIAIHGHRPFAAPLEAAHRLATRIDSTQHWLAQPNWSSGSVHSGIRYLEPDARTVGQALAKHPGGGGAAAELRTLGGVFTKVGRQLDNAARSRGPMDLSAADRTAFAQKLAQPLADGQRLVAYAKGVLQQTLDGAAQLH